MESVASVKDRKYAEICRRYRELRDQCHELQERRITGVELINAVESKCRRLGQLIRRLDSK